MVVVVVVVGIGTPVGSHGASSPSEGCCCKLSSHAKNKGWVVRRRLLWGDFKEEEVVVGEEESLGEGSVGVFCVCDDSGSLHITFPSPPPPPPPPPPPAIQYLQ